MPLLALVLALPAVAADGRTPVADSLHTTVTFQQATTLSRGLTLSPGTYDVTVEIGTAQTAKLKFEQHGNPKGNLDAVLHACPPTDPLCGGTERPGDPVVRGDFPTLDSMGFRAGAPVVVGAQRLSVKAQSLVGGKQIVVGAALN